MCRPAVRAAATARDAGVDRVVTVGTGIESSEKPSRSPTVMTRCSRCSASTRIRPAGARRTGSTSSGSSSRTTRRSRWGDGPRFLPRPRTPDSQRRLFEAQLDLASELGKPVVIHNRDADDDTARVLAGFHGTVVLHCFSSPGLLEPALDRGYFVSSSRGTSRSRRPRPCGRRPRVSRPSASWPRPRVRTWPRSRGGAVERARERRPHRGGPGRRSRREPRELAAQIDANASVAFSLPTLLTPNKDLGQHFLVDDNILGVIGRLAELDPQDVVLEVGPGLGVLTTASPTGSPGCMRSSWTACSSRTSPTDWANGPTIELLYGDAMRIDLSALRPAPEKLVANLPYNIATPLVVESLDGCRASRLWTVMVQREVADQFFARPGTKAYGAVSVLLQLATERTGFHPVSRTVFRPPPERRLARRLPAPRAPRETTRT